jgi:L-aspartate oxidase
VRATGEQETQLKWKAQHPLAYGLFREHLIDQQCRAFGHASGAANSLLECLVFAEQAALDIHAHDAETEAPPLLSGWDESRVTEPDEEVVVSHNWDELRHFMWDYVGIVRSNKRLERAKRRVDLLRREIVEYYLNFRVSNDLLELRNLVEVADLIIRSAMCRHESRGLHYTIDFPYSDDRVQKRPTILIPDSYSPY